jgi:Na+/H+-dicarboxylate symporter
MHPTNSSGDSFESGITLEPKKERPLHKMIFISLVLGLALGLLIKMGPSFLQALLVVLEVGADVFLRLLKMVILPLVVTSIFVGVTNVSSVRDLGRVGLKTGLYYLSTSLLAILTGLIVVNLLEPGVGANLSLGSAAKEGIMPEGSLTSILTRVIPTNPLEALAKFDMVGVIFFTIMFSIFAMKSAETHRAPVVNLMGAVYEIMMKMVGAIIRLAPLGVFCLVAKLVATLGFDVFMPLMKYMVTVILALGIHFFIILPAIFWWWTRSSPWAYMQALAPALLTAFSSASSAATLPLTMECAENRGGVSEKVTSIVLPLGATVNMDGTALYEGVAVLFIAQVLGHDLAFAQQLIVLLTALLVSVGAAGIPHAGLVMMVIILEAVGLPLEATGMIWAVDRVVDMARTATNVWSDAVGAAVIDHGEES